MGSRKEEGVSYHHCQDKQVWGRVPGEGEEEQPKVFVLSEVWAASGSWTGTWPLPTPLLTAPMERHRSVNPWQCKRCDEILQNITTFVKHVKRVHYVKRLATAQQMLTSPDTL